MKLSKKILRIRRKYVSVASVILFISLGLVVTYILNNQITQQKQTIQSRADVDPEEECRARSYEYCEKPGVAPWMCTMVDGTCYLSGTEPESPPPQNEGACNKSGQSCCSDGDTDYCNGGLICDENICVQPDSSEPPVGGQSCSGTCANVNNYSCSAGFEKGLCPGTPNNVQCCSGELSEKDYSLNEDPGDDPPVGGQDPDSDDPEPIKKPPPPPPGADDPKGVVDQNDGHTIRGWAFDPNDTNVSLEIHIYIYPEGGSAEGYNIGATTIDRSDVNDAYGINGYHGFDWKVPPKWCNGTPYIADVFAINIGEGGTTTLGGSTWSCGSGGDQGPDLEQGQNDFSERDALLKQNFDGRWYLSVYTDVRQDKGYGANSNTAFQHYLAHGMSEKRNPNPNFDEKYYLDSNPDVANAVTAEQFRSGFEHYLMHGQKQPECRKPKSDRNAPAPCSENSDTDTKSNSTVDVAVSLQGIGKGADIKNPVRPADIKVISGEKTIHTASDFLTYDKVSGNFVNSDFNLGAVASGSYKLVIQMDGYVDKVLLGADGSEQVVLVEREEIKTALSQLSAGDSAPLPGGDNKIDIIDYNALLGCMPGNPPSACPNNRLADLNDDGVVDQSDLDILRQNIGETGFFLPSDEYDCKANPVCGSGRDSLQMCPLLCTPKTLRS